MGIMTPLHGARTSTADSYMRLRFARRDMNLLFAKWLASNPNRQDVETEIEATANVLFALLALKGGRDDA